MAVARRVKLTEDFFEFIGPCCWAVCLYNAKESGSECVGDAGCGTGESAAACLGGLCRRPMNLIMGWYCCCRRARVDCIVLLLCWLLMEGPR